MSPLCYESPGGLALGCWPHGVVLRSRVQYGLQRLNELLSSYSRTLIIVRLLKNRRYTNYL